MINRFILILFILSFNSTTAQVQEIQPSRPKIGLVLSGGGAKGFAHIGVIKAMEKEDIRPDFITGTSMGSIVGGLYALGYSADELEKIVRIIDWDQILSNNIPLSYISYEEKEYYNRYLLELYVKNGIPGLPSGLIEGQMLSEMLSHFTWSSTKYKSFDDFPIPFRCIATDVGTGKEIIFKDGPLSEALRASMSIPTAFTAAVLDSTLAVDGGVLNNFPVEEARKMGADIVIGVNVSGGFEPVDEINNIVGILLQVSMIPSLERMEEQIKMCDIYIEPDLKDNSTASFSNFEEILELGDLAGEKHRKDFRNLAKRVKASSKNDGIDFGAQSVIISEIKLKGLHSISPQLVMSKFGHEQGDTLNRAQIENGVRRVYGINSFKKVIYHFEQTSNNRAALVLKMFEKPEQVIKAGIHYDNLFSAGVTLNYTMRNTLGKSTRSIVALDLSGNPRLRLDHLKYVGVKRKTALNLRYDYRSLQVPNYSNGELQDLEINRNHIVGVGIMGTQSLKDFSFLSFKYEFEGFKYKIGNINPEGIKAIRFNRFFVNGGYTRNTFNDRNYPSKGANLDVTVNIYPWSDYNLKYKEGIDTIYIPVDSINSEMPVTKAELNQVVKELTPEFFTTIFFRYSRITPISKKIQFIPSISLGITLSNDVENSIFNDFIVGGTQRLDFDDIPFLGLNYRELTTPNFGTLKFQVQHILFKNFFFRYGINSLLFHEHISLNQLDKFIVKNLFENNSLIGYGFNLKYRSYIGPISFGISYNNRDPHPRYYFALGFSFNYED